jgi:Uma2 family endonuclease
MTTGHNWAMRDLREQLGSQVDRRQYVIDENSTRLRIPSGAFYIPDLCVIPRPVARRLLEQRRDRLEVYEEPLPLVVEVWSPSTGNYDVEIKLRNYQERGDAEIWRVHPIERTLTAWRRQPDRSYVETVYREGVIQPVALPGVRIELASLFG